MLTLSRAIELLQTTTTETHLILHAKNVMIAMGGMAEYFDENVEYWMAIGYLHDFDYQQYPDEHLRHTEEQLKEAGLKEAGLKEDDIRAILSHGYGIINNVKPITNLEKSLYTVDELTGIIQAASKMRPNGIVDMDIRSFMKKFKDKSFAAKCNREIIKNGCSMLNLDVNKVATICIEAMKKHADELHLIGVDAK